MWQTYILEELDGNTDKERLQTAAGKSNCTIYATKAVYDFTNENIVTNTALVTVSKKDNLFIDWQGALIKVKQNNDVDNYGTCFIDFVDSTGGVFGFTFDDVSFVHHPDKKGVIPVRLNNVTKDTNGFVLHNAHIYRGQSLLTVASDTGFMASNIKFTGEVRGTYCYYGINLAKSGSDFSGSFYVHTFFRLFFIYGVDGVNINCRGYKGLPSSGNGVIDTVSKNTKNITVNAHYENMDGPVRVSAATGNITNVNLTIRVDACLSNLYLYDSMCYLDKGAIFILRDISCNLITPVANINSYNVNGAGSTYTFRLLLNGVDVLGSPLS